MDPKHPFSHTKRFFLIAGLWVLCLVASLLGVRVLSTWFGVAFNPAIVVVLSFLLSVAALVIHDRKRVG